VPHSVACSALLAVPLSSTPSCGAAPGEAASAFPPSSCSRVRRGAAQDGSHAAKPVRGRGRLGDVVVGSDLEANNGVELGRLGGHHDYRTVELARIARQTSMPDRRGSITSRRTRSGWSAAEPLECLYPVARRTVTKKPSLSRFTVSASTKDSSSSTTRTRAGGAPRSSSPARVGACRMARRKWIAALLAGRVVSRVTSQVRDVPVRWRVLSFGGAGE